MKNKEKLENCCRSTFKTFAIFNSYIFTKFERGDYEKFNKIFKNKNFKAIEELFSWENYEVFMRAADVYEFQGLKLMLDLFPIEKQKILLQDEKKAAGLLSLILNPSNNKENKYKGGELFNEIIVKNNADPLLEEYKKEVVKTLINAISPNIVKLFQNEIDDLMGQGQSSSDETDKTDDIGNAADSEKEEDIGEQPKKKVHLDENQVINLEAQNIQNHLEQQENTGNENTGNENNVQQNNNNNNNGNQEQQQNANIIHNTEHINGTSIVMNKVLDEKILAQAIYYSDTGEILPTLALAQQIHQNNIIFHD